MTANLGIRTPFYITRWEIEVSRSDPSSTRCTAYTQLREGPRISVLDGSMEKRARLEPKVCLGIPV
jgi:hypothetical protein